MTTEDKRTETGAKNNGLLVKALHFALGVDAEVAKGVLRSVKAAHPNVDRRAIADQLIRRTRWKGAALGFGTGLPANPFVMVPAAIAGAGTLLRMPVVLAAQIAPLFDEAYLDDGEPPFELLVPIMGGRMMSEVARELAIRGGMGVTRQAIRAILTKETLAQVRRLALKYLGLKVGQKAIITKTVPIIGGIIGSAWNFAEVKIVGDRIYSYFENHPISADPL
jgi:hypothetical protein